MVEIRCRARRSSRSSRSSCPTTYSSSSGRTPGGAVPLGDQSMHLHAETVHDSAERADFLVHAQILGGERDIRPSCESVERAGDGCDASPEAEQCTLERGRAVYGCDAGESCGG